MVHSFQHRNGFGDGLVPVVFSHRALPDAPRDILQEPFLLLERKCFGVFDRTRQSNQLLEREVSRELVVYLLRPCHLNPPVPKDSRKMLCAARTESQLGKK